MPALFKEMINIQALLYLPFLAAFTLLVLQTFLEWCLDHVHLASSLEARRPVCCSCTRLDLSLPLPSSRLPSPLLSTYSYPSRPAIPAQLSLPP